MIRVLCIGHICYDIIFPVDSFPRENTKCVLPASQESAGGPACNAASLLALWKVDTAFAGIVGSDMYGEKACEDLSRTGADTRLLEKRFGHQTPLSFVIVNTLNGSRTILNRKSPSGHLHISAAELRAAFSGEEAPELLFFDGHELPASLAALEAFPAARTVLDAGSRRAGTETLAGLVDYCVASERFASEMTGFDLRHPGGSNQRKALAGLKALGARCAAVTLGEEGCVFMQGPPDASPSFFRIAAFTSPSAPVVDTTAAGDIFHGAFAAGLLEGRDFPASLRLASVAAGLSVQRAGGRKSIPGRSEVYEREKAWTAAIQEI